MLVKYLRGALAVGLLASVGTTGGAAAPANEARLVPSLSLEELRRLPRDCPLIYDSDWLRDTNDDEYVFATLAAVFAGGTRGQRASRTLTYAAPPRAFASRRVPRARRLRVSANGRFLVWEGGRPFFYLGDTAWELFHRPTREEADLYLRDRAAKRFTVIQAVVLAEFAGLTEPNANGDLPLHGQDPARPNEAYFRHVDWVVDRAASLGLVMGMLPTWGDKVNKAWGAGPEVFTPENARHHAIWRAMAEGIRKGDEGRNLITYHPHGGRSSAEFFHAQPWLDFNILQSGHGRKDVENHRMVAADYARTPVKPVLDGEPPYEDHPVNWDPRSGWFDAYDVRKASYWALFAGAAGHTYGCHDIWQFYDPTRRPAISAARTPWREALHLPGAGQMRHARALLESRPFLERVPDQSLLASDSGTGGEHVRATRADQGSYAFVYTPLGRPVTVRLDRLSGRSVNAWWFDPRTGAATAIGVFPREGERRFAPSTSGPGQDWVLVLDDTSRRWRAPGLGRR